MILKTFNYFFFVLLINLQIIGQVKFLPENAIALKELLAKENNNKKKAELLASLSVYYQKKFVFDSAINYRLEAMKLAQNFSKNDSMFSNIAATNMLKISRLYLTTGQFEQAIQYSTKAKPYITNSKALLVLFYTEKAEALRMYAQAGIKKIEESKIYYDSLTACLAMKYPDAGKKRIAMDLGYCDFFNTRKDTKSALKYIKSADSLAQYHGDEILRAQVKYMYGTTYFEIKKYKEALPLLLEAEKTANTWSPDLYVELQRNIARCYGALGSYEKGFRFYDKFAPLRDSIYVKAAESSLADADAKFQNKEKQAQIEIKNLQLVQNNIQKKWYLTGLYALLAALGLLFWNFQTKQKANRIINEKNVALEKLNTDLIEANQTKAKLFGIISHDLRSPISQVYQFLKLQQLNPNLLSADQKTDLSSKIQAATGILLETMEDLLLWSKTQLSQFNTNIEEVDLKPIVSQCIDLMKLNIAAKNISLQTNISNDNQVVTDPYFLQIIIRNLLQNAIKASPENGEINITFENNQISIENAGAIFTQKDYETTLINPQKQENLNGLGLKLIDELTKKIGARIMFEEKSGNTVVNLKI
jgi:signal transduction histidine kinase